VLAGAAAGLAFVIGTFLTFGQFSGSRRGQQGLLFDPATQHPKVLAVWKELEPLPRIVDTPILILAGLIVFGLGNAFLYRSVARAWPPGLASQAWRLALIIWLPAAFAEFMGPFNVLHQPASLSLIGLTFWAVPAFAEALVLVLVLHRGRDSLKPEDVFKPPLPATRPSAGT
jgi:hypothetical protein